MEPNPIPEPIEKELSFFPLLLCTLAGSVISVLKKCSHEVPKHAALGLMVIVTGIMSGFSIFLLLDSLDKPTPLCIAFACIWGTFIIIIDRYILAGYRKRKEREFRQLGPRLFLALVISVTISGPLEIQAFKGDVDKQLAIIKGKQVSDYRKLKISDFQDQIDAYQKEKDKDQNLLNSKIAIKTANTRPQIINVPMKNRRGRYFRDNDRKIQTRPVNITQAYTLEDNDIAKLQKATDSLAVLIKATQTKIDNFDKSHYADIIQKNKGLLINLRALHEVWSQDLISGIMGTFFFLLILGFEMLPVLSKFISSTTAYDKELEVIEQRIANYNTWRLLEEMRIRNSYAASLQADHDFTIQDKQQDHQAKVDLQALIDSKFLGTEGQILDDLGIERERVQKALNKNMIEKISESQKRIGEKAIELWENKKIEELPDNLDKFINEIG